MVRGEGALQRALDGVVIGRLAGSGGHGSCRHQEQQEPNQCLCLEERHDGRQRLRTSLLTRSGRINWDVGLWTLRSSGQASQVASVA